MSASEPIAVVLSTCPVETAEPLARQMVERRLAACVNIIPKVTSYYWWEGEIQEDGESLLVIKCRRESVDTLTAELVKAHPYDVPEVVALEVGGGNPDYLRWVLESTEGN